MIDMKIFSGRANPDLSAQICDYLGLPLAEISIGNFPDGEIYLQGRRGHPRPRRLPVQPTCPPVNENLMELLIIIE